MEKKERKRGKPPRYGFGERLTRLIKEKNIKQGKLGFTQSTVSGWARGYSLPNVEEGYDLAVALQVSLEYLVTGREPDPKVEPPILKEIYAELKPLPEVELCKILGVIRMYLSRFGEETKESLDA